jgi:hypothetical protein
MNLFYLIYILSSSFLKHGCILGEESLNTGYKMKQTKCKCRREIEIFGVMNCMGIHTET